MLVSFSILRILHIIYVGSAPGWNFPHSTWSICIDRLLFWSVNCGMRCHQWLESPNTLSFKRALNAHFT